MDTNRPQQFLKILSIVHIALVSGLIIFMLFSYFQNEGFVANMSSDDIFIYITPILAFAGYFLGQFLFKKHLEKIKRDDNLSLKVRQYFLASLIKFALIEGPCFIALFAYFTTRNALHFTIAVSLIAYLIAQRPTKNRIRQDIPLLREEQQVLDL